MRRSLLLLPALVLVAVACGSAGVTTTSAQSEASSSSAAESTTTTPPTTAAAETTTSLEGFEASFPATVAGAEIPERPERIVSLSSTSTEVLFEIGAGDQVIAVDSFSNHPPEAPLTDLSAFEPNVEAIAELDPDLVVVFFDPGDFISGLQALGIPVIHHEAAATLDDAYRQIRELGAATGHLSEAEFVVIDMEIDIADIVTANGQLDTPLTYYHEVDNTYYSATSQTFIGSIYGLFGLENIADPADPDGFGFPQLSPEYIIEADPDLIFYGCALWCGTNPETIAERPGWAGMTAVQDGAMVELDDDIASRWGPRLVDLVRLIGESIEQVQGADA